MQIDEKENGNKNGEEKLIDTILFIEIVNWWYLREEEEEEKHITLYSVYTYLKKKI